MATKTQTQTQTAENKKVRAPKAAGNTPVKTAAKKVAPEQKATAKKAASKKTYALVAGAVAKITHKGLKAAISYHVKKGNLALCAEGVKLTEQGATLWKVERIEIDPAKFQELASFLHGKGEVPAEFSSQPITQVAESVQFPNMLYWGGFTRNVMRQCFAAIWAKA